MERVCNKTEFEVEGWRKIPPLMKILDHYIHPTVISRMKLELKKLDPIVSKENHLEAYQTCDFTKLHHRLTGDKSLTIRDTEIYKHFTAEDTKHIKIAIYVNAIVPINQNLKDVNRIVNVGNHCVVVKGITKWPNSNGIDCLELETFGESDQTRFLPVDFPVFEEVQVKVMKIFKEAKGASDLSGRKLNKYGGELAEIKWGNVPNNWYDIKKETKKDDSKVAVEEKCKYGMLFVRGIHPSFKLKFTS